MSKPSVKNCRGCGRDTTNKGGYCRKCMGGAIPEPKTSDDRALERDFPADRDEREVIEKLVEGDE